MSPLAETLTYSLFSLPVFLGLSSAIFVIWYIVSAVLAWYPRRHIPGPTLASFSYLWILWITWVEKTKETYTDLHDKYNSSLVRIGPYYVVTNNPKILRQIVAGAKSRYNRDTWYTAARFHPEQNHMGTIMDVKKHDEVKAKTASGYSGRENLDLEVAVDEQIERLVALIRRKFLSTEGPNGVARPVDFAKLTSYFTLDVITRLAYGEPFGHLDEGEDVYGWIEAISPIIKYMTMTTDSPLLRKVLFWKPLWKVAGPRATDKAGLGKIISVSEKLIAARFAPGAPARKDMMGGFIRKGMTQMECQSESVLQISAGSDTTACTIRAAMLHLMATPRAYHRLRAEIKDAIVKNKASSPIKYEEALKLPYLQAVVYEGFRIRNPMTYGHFKVVPPEGEVLDGVFLPGGTGIGHNTLALTRNREVFGDDVDVFRPERFIECSEDKKIERVQALEIIFGGGRWQCAGKAVAMMELNKIFFELMRRFDFHLLDLNKPWEEKTYMVVQHSDMWVSITQSEEEM